MIGGGEVVGIVRENDVDVDDLRKICEVFGGTGLALLGGKEVALFQIGEVGDGKENRIGGSSERCQIGRGHWL